MAAPLVKRTALYRTHLALGGLMTDYHGWQVAGQFAEPAEEARRVREEGGLADTSWLAKFEIMGAAAEFRPRSAHSGSVWALGRDHWLATSGPREREAVWRETQGWVAAHACLRVTDVTSVYAALLLAGPRSREVLHRLTSLDVSDRAMPEGSCAQTGLAHVHGILLRRDLGGLPAFRLLVAREYGEFIWEAVIHTGHAFGIVPFGLRALELLDGKEGRPAEPAAQHNRE